LNKLKNQNETISDLLDLVDDSERGIIEKLKHMVKNQGNNTVRSCNSNANKSSASHTHDQTDDFDSENYFSKETIGQSIANSLRLNERSFEVDVSNKLLGRM